MVRSLVVGMGNPLLRDDAVGIRLAAFLRGRLGEAPGSSWVEECSAGGLEILDLVAGHDRLVLLDSIKAGGPPGSWYRFDGAALHETMNLRNVHDTNLATALELGRRLGLPIPAEGEVHVFAVEVEDNLSFDERMTDALEARFPEYASEICGEVASLLGTASPREARDGYGGQVRSVAERLVEPGLAPALVEPLAREQEAHLPPARRQVHLGLEPRPGDGAEREGAVHVGHPPLHAVLEDLAVRLAAAVEGEGDLVEAHGQPRLERDGARQHGDEVPVGLLLPGHRDMVPH